MKRPFFILLLLLPLLSWGQKEYSLKGTDFWLTIPNGMDIDSILIQVCSNDTCTANFTFGHNTLSLPLERRPIDSAEINSYYNNYHINGQNYYGNDTLHYPIASLRLPARHVHTNFTDTILSKSIHITTTDSAYVHLYAFGANGGATSVIPTHALQPEYIVQTWPDANGGAFVILATEDNTEVDIVLSNPSTDGLPLNRHHRITLNAGNTYQLISQGTFPDYKSSFTGTQITALHNKKIAVFQSNRNMETTIAFDSTPVFDYTLNQAVPIAYAGKFYKSSYSNSIGSIITAIRDSCIVYLRNQPIDTLNASESCYLTPPLNFYSIFSSSLETSQPSIVCQYGNSTHYSQYEYGRPTCLYLPPVGSGGFEGFVSPDYKFEDKVNAPRPPHTNLGYPYGDLTACFDSPLTQPYDSISYANYPFVSSTSWMHLYGLAWARVHSNHKRFAAYRFGTFVTYVVDSEWYNTVYTYSHGGAYAYNVCFNMIFQTKIFYADGIPNNSLASTSFCLGHEILFNTNCDTNQTYFHWDFGDGHTALGPIVRHSYAAPGSYLVQTIIDYANTPLSDHSRDTIYGTVHISPIDTLTSFDSCCSFPYRWVDTLITAPGTYLHPNPSVGNCLPIDRLILSLDTSSVTTSFSDTICQGDSITWRRHTCAAPGIYTDTLSQINGCDSILHLNLSVWPTPDVVIQQLTPDGQIPIQLQGSVADNSYSPCRLTWQSSPTDPSLSGQEHSPLISVSPAENTAYTLAAEYDSLPSCIGKNLYRVSIATDNVLWIPNIFTPGRESNALFTVTASKLSQYHIAIFNRQGFRVFQSDDISQPWDGTCDGKPCHTGTYAYTIIYAFADNPNQQLRHTGTITLIR